MRNRFVLFIFCFTYFGSVEAQTNKNQLDSLNETYYKPKPFGFITHVPQDLWLIAKSPVQKENWKGLGITSATTALLLW